MGTFVLAKFTAASASLSLRRNSPNTVTRYLSNAGIRSSRKVAGPELSIPAGNGKSMDLKSVWKPFLFACGFTGLSFTGATIWQYETILKKSLFQRNSWRSAKRGTWRDEINKQWNLLSDSNKVAGTLIALNTLVCAAWQVPRWLPFMTRYFTCSTKLKPAFLPMILSGFSHSSVIHLACNMFVLQSFTPNLVNYFGREQYIALYLSSGVWASLLSKTVRIIRRSPAVSVGASGAILGLVAFHCLLFPDADLGIVFIPFVSIKAATAIYGIVGLDIAGILLQWQYLDHAAHLGGAMFGLFYYKYGLEIYMQEVRGPLIRMWHDFRSSVKKG